MNLTAKIKILHSVKESSIGMPCPCCVERNDFDAIDWPDAPGLKALQRAFGESILSTDSVVAFRLQPIAQGIEKRGEAFFYLAPNMVMACSFSCKQQFETMWMHHPDRPRFISYLLAYQAGDIKTWTTSHQKAAENA
jgi:hypothetical protein